MDYWAEINQTMKEINAEADKLRLDAEEMLNEVRKMKESFSWGAWEPYKLKFPKRIKGKWYWPGNTVYRREKMRYLSSSGMYQYGDDFDVLASEQQ